ncbi:MAG TPA: hypothetical protein VIJ93_09265, partial [bacterium]
MVKANFVKNSPFRALRGLQNAIILHPSMTKGKIRASGLNIIRKEAAAISAMEAYINNAFVNAVELIATCKGRLVISGVGKSAIIAQKIVATLNSTGTSAAFMHAADAIHGDL